MKPNSTLLTALISIFSFTAVAQVDTAYYSVTAKGKITGGQKAWKNGADEYHFTYQFNDRGRGDSTTSIINTNAAGLITSVNTQGIDYFKNPYSEIFSITGDSAVWTVNGERRSKKFNSELYSAGGAPAILGLFIKWIDAQPGRRVAVLPDGFIHLDAPVLKTVNINGKIKKLKLYAAYFEPTPTPLYIWMTEDMQFFAMVNAWNGNISKGFESWSEPLFALQENAGQSYFAKELNNNSKALQSEILFTHCTLFRSAGASVQKDMSVQIVKGKVTAIYPSAAQPKIIKADTVIDCKGKFLMPGLWDMHGHYGKEEGAAYLAGGVTHIRDMGNDKILLTYKKQIAENKLLGPDITYISGFIDKEDPFQGPTGAIIKSLPEGLAAIRDYHKLGYQQIKLYSAIKPEWVKPMAALAHSLGMRVCGHIPAFMTAEQAIAAGYDEVTHMNFLFLNFMGDTVDTRTPARFRLVGDYGGNLDIQSDKVKRLVELMKKNHVALDPTLNVWQGMFDEFKGDTAHSLKPVVSWLPDSWLANLSIQSPFGSEDKKIAYKAAFSNMLKMLKLLYDNGILLVPGTDGGDAVALHHELELYALAGIPANQVLKIATYNAALDCKMQNIYGDIQTGRAADLILIDGDPSVNISDIRRVELVIKNNRIYQPKQLLAAQGWKYYY